MISIRIDKREILVPEGITLLDAANNSGIAIPSMCYLEGCGNNPSCMVCLVKDNKSGALVPSCATRVREGMDITATSEEVTVARQQALELLMSDHVGDCEAPCSLACPAGMDIPRMNRLIGEKRFTEALEVVRRDIALPHVLGYVCPAPCEKACRRKQVDEAVSICLLKRITAVEGSGNEVIIDAIARTASKNLRKEKVAVIGSGPAGLAAAYYLGLMGYSCVVFEKEGIAGGMLRSAIPEKNLPGSVIDQEVDLIRLTGATFRFNTKVDRAFYESEIKNNFSAVIVATGDLASDNSLAGLLDTGTTGYKVHEDDFSSSVQGIFTCGSTIRPQKMAVRSVAQGKIVASSVHSYITGKKFIRQGRLFNSRFDKLTHTEIAEYLNEADSSGRISPSSGFIAGFSIDEAITEARRCLHCDCRAKDNCSLRVFSHEYGVERKKYLIGERRAISKQFQHDLIVYEPAKCIKCGLCVEISGSEGEKFGMAFTGRGFDVLISTPLGKGLHESLTVSAGKCVNACPTGALAFRKEDAGKQSD
ncbi:MAG: 2Fe-2S iron-sulfur cluster-binding protein [Bacteroidales bacterium]